MSEAVAPSTGRRYGLQRVCRAWHVNRSTITSQQARERSPEPPRKRGPKPVWTDDEIALGIRWAIAASPFHGEGYRKMWARLRHAGVCAGKDRVRRIMREHGLLSPQRTAVPAHKLPHDGTITTERPDEMWGTDLTQTVTVLDGRAYVAFAIDHCTGECVGVHAARTANRWDALEPIRQGVRCIFGAFEQNIATGLAIRHDHGSQYMSDTFQEEIAFLGCTSSPSFVHEPEGNGVAERFARTVKEQLLWVEHFDTIEDLNRALQLFRMRYNTEWLVERHNHHTPAQVRATLTPTTLEAAA